MRRRDLLALLAFAPIAARGQDKAPSSAGIPVTGKRTGGAELLDAVMLDNLRRIGCSAAALAISRKGVLTHSRGYGWSDRNRSVPTEPDTMIGIASCDKPITAAAIRQLVREGRLSLDLGVFSLLRIAPRGAIADFRVRSITLRHLLEHKAGWQGEPLERAIAIARDEGHKGPIPVDVLLGYLMTQKLKDAPGARFEYCNSCYDTLRHVVATVSGLSTVDYFRRALFVPYGIFDLRGFEAPNSPRRAGDPPLVWNEGGPVSASAPALCTFMRCYWQTGEPRDGGRPLWRMDGSLPGSTAMMLWLPDGTDLAFIFNGRASGVSHNAIKEGLESVLGRVA